MLFWYIFTTVLIFSKFNIKYQILYLNLLQCTIPGVTYVSVISTVVIHIVFQNNNNFKTILYYILAHIHIWYIPVTSFKWTIKEDVPNCFKIIKAAETYRTSVKNVKNMLFRANTPSTISRIFAQTSSIHFHLDFKFQVCHCYF